MSMAGTPGGRLRSGFARATVAALFGLAVLAGLSAWLALRAPSWWTPVVARAADADQGAAFEQAIVAEFTKVRAADAEWAVRIRAADVNEWLASRLPQWLESRELPALGQAQVHLQPGLLRLGVARGPAVIWTAAEPVAQGGGVQIRSASSGMGRLPLPGMGPDLSQAVDGWVGKPIPLPDGRQVRVLDLEVLDGELRLRLRTESR